MAQLADITSFHLAKDRSVLPEVAQSAAEAYEQQVLREVEGCIQRGMRWTRRQLLRRFIVATGDGLRMKDEERGPLCPFQLEAGLRIILNETLSQIFTEHNQTKDDLTERPTARDMKRAAGFE